MPIYTIKVSPENTGERLDVFLTQNLPEILSRTFAKNLIDEGHVTVNQNIYKPHQKVRAGDEVSADIPEMPALSDIEPENIPLDIFYEDAFLSVINKPAGMLVHPANSRRTGTLVNALLYHYHDLSTVNEAFRPGIVHRLDRETSGIVVVARDNRTHIRLARQFEKRRIKKKYVALVKGSVNYDEGVVETGLARHPLYFDKRAVAYDESAKEARTVYRVIKRFDNKISLVALFPLTGRTHQLRVHMNHLGHPILGDDKYGSDNPFFRLALHAQALGFQHPETKHFIEFSTSIPPEFLEPFKVINR